MPVRPHLPVTSHRSLISLAVVVLLSGCAVQLQPISEQEARAQLVPDREAIFGSQEPVTAPMTLQQAMARALKYNLDYRVKLMEEALSQRQLDHSNLDMLPKLTLAAGYNARNNDNASSSQNVMTGQQSLAPSISSERHDLNADLGVSWNVLDFGVSYYSAQQQADRVLVLGERKRKVAQQLMQQVREAWWQALGAQQLQGRIDTLLKEARGALDDARQVEAQKLRAPLESLNYRRQLLEVIRQLSLVRNTLVQAKPRLAALVNLAPGSTFEVAQPAGMPVPEVKLPLDQMEDMALIKRPETNEARYNERISATETRKALAKLMPGLEFSLGQHYDSNTFLVNKTWSDAGLRVSWNLLNIFSAKSIRGEADAQLAVAKAQRMAVNMAVLTQVHVAYLDFEGRTRQYKLEQELNDVESTIAEQTRRAMEQGAQSRLQSVLVEASALYASLRLYQSYGDLQNSYGQLAASLGLDPVPGTTSGFDLAALSQAFQQAESQWQGQVQGEKL